MELYFETREEWRNWLEENHNTISEAWLICYKKDSGRIRIPYAETVEEALCFGWIDGKIKSVNKDYFITRFTPRRKGSRWSKYNIERVKRMKKLGLMKPAGLKAYRDVLENPHLAYSNEKDGSVNFPEDLMEALKSGIRALNNFMLFPPSSQRMYIEWLNSAKQKETRERRIERILRMSESNTRPGMM